MNVGVEPTQQPQSLDQASDDELRAIIKEASSLLRAREETRKKDAIAQIKLLAKEHGLDVAVERPKRKRGRPPARTTGGIGGST
jgi:hypothetical protein